jgi:hypothetical protein
MKDLAIIVPSRHRPSNFARLCAAFAEPTRALLVVCQDDDDEPYDLPPDTSVTRRVGPRQGMVAWTNTVALELMDLYPYLGSMGDDHMPRTEGWADAVVAALHEMERQAGVGMVYTNDLFQGPALPTAVYMSSTIVKALGYLGLPGLNHFYCDNVWLALGRRLRCLYYLDSVVVEHVHPSAHKAGLDEMYNDSMAHWSDDRAIFERYMRGEFNEDVRRVNAYREMAPSSLAEDVARNVATVNYG